jgi:hypothetical protein
VCDIGSARAAARRETSFAHRRHRHREIKQTEYRRARARASVSPIRMYLNSKFCVSFFILSACLVRDELRGLARRSERSLYRCSEFSLCGGRCDKD